MPYSDPLLSSSIPLVPIHANDLDNWLENAPEHQRRWLQASTFKAGAGQYQVVPGSGGEVELVVFGLNTHSWLAQLTTLPANLAAGDYRLQCDWTREQRLLAALGWGLASYRFSRYKANNKPAPRLLADDDVAEDAAHLYAAQSLVRDLINTPTEDMGPDELEAAASDMARQYQAEISVIRGEALLVENFPAIHAVGRASHREPRLICLEWGEAHHPLVSLCGKGVCFDTGGLDMKSTAGMALMKKDMGGAAHVLALAQLVMEYRLPVRLQVLIPAVENAVAGNAYRPGDVIPTRLGLTIEIGNTDAEGRVVLSDALAYASEHAPDLVMDFATLTGAARVAMGPDLPPLFSNSSEIARGLLNAGIEVEDQMWELPLYRPYREMIDSNIADINNSAKSSFGGCITAALFLQEFVDADLDWVHVDTYGWNQSSTPGRPAGGEAFGLRAAFRFLQERYAKAGQN